MTERRQPVPTPPATRRERRAEARAERSAQRTTRSVSKAPTWRSPMVLFTGAALLVGLAIVAFALLGQPKAPTDDIVAPAITVPANLADGRTLGEANAPVTVEIWSDFQCPGCRQLATRVEPPLIAQFVVPGTARFVYHDAAFQGQRVNSAWDESVQPAAAARCATDQGKFWTMHDWLFANWTGENEGGFRAERLRAIAEGAGLDMAAYDACMAVGDKQSAVQAETEQGLSIGVNQTPTLIINGTRYGGQMSVAAIGAAITQAAGGASPAPTT